MPYFRCFFRLCFQRKCKESQTRERRFSLLNYLTPDLFSEYNLRLQQQKKPFSGNEAASWVIFSAVAAVLIQANLCVTNDLFTLLPLVIIKIWILPHFFVKNNYLSTTQKNGLTCFLTSQMHSQGYTPLQFASFYNQVFHAASICYVSTFQRAFFKRS